MLPVCAGVAWVFLDWAEWVWRWPLSEWGLPAWTPAWQLVAAIVVGAGLWSGVAMRSRLPARSPRILVVEVLLSLALWAMAGCAVAYGWVMGSDSNLGPPIAVFVAGPIGLVVGGVLGMLSWVVRGLRIPRAPALWRGGRRAML